MILAEYGEVNKIVQAREKYKPKKIECFLIAEAPPNAIERFFYYEKVKQADYLFLGIMEVLDKELKNEFLNKHRHPGIKEEMLNRFKNHGFFLIDLFERPINEPEPLPMAIKKLTNKLKQMVADNLITVHTPIILIKANVYDALFKHLKDNGYKVIDVRIPFPGSGHQTEFHKKFAEALNEAGFGIKQDK